MIQQISKLWGNLKFINLTNNAKLFYVYLLTNPSITDVGIIYISFSNVMSCFDFSMTEIRNATKELIDGKYIHVKKHNKIVYFIIPEKFKRLAKSELALSKIRDELNSLPDEIVEFLESINISTDAKTSIFKKPTVDDVLKYSLSQGYNINAEDFVDFYENQALSRGITDAWMDSKGKRVRDWKAKMKKVWFRPENKLKIPKNTPIGYELFHVLIDGVKKFPEEWKDGKPWSKDFITNKMLNSEFNKISKND